MLTLLTGLVGVFIALDLFVFYVFFEVMLIPMYFIIGIWGGTNRLYAAIKFFIYTMAGSLLMLVAIVALVWRIQAVTGVHLLLLRPPAAARRRRWARSRPGSSPRSPSPSPSRCPIFPFHTWLPDAHVEAPTAGSVLLAGGDAQDRDLRLPPVRRAVLSPGRAEPDGEPRSWWCWR